MSSPTKTQAFIALGGNQGDVLASFRQALSRLNEHGVEVVQVSSAYRTEALTAEDNTEPAADYWNAVCEIMITQSARELLNLCLEVEQESGRVRSKRWESRPLDLDLLVYGDEQINEEGLVVPHPRMRERAFVMRPLMEIAAELCLPSDGKRVGDVCSATSGDGVLEVVGFSLEG